jgi:hypothetical protein
MENRGGGGPWRAISSSRRPTNMGRGLGLLLPLEELSGATIGFQQIRNLLILRILLSAKISLF